MPLLHHRTCNICEANCGIIIEHEGDRIVSIKGDPQNALSRGHICPKAVALQDLQNDPDRLRKPMRRDGETWTEISWEQAFDEISARTRAILARDPAAAAVYLGNPNVHNYGNVLNAEFLMQALGQPQRYSAGTVDQFPVQVASLRMLGHSELWGVADIDRAHNLVVLGGNPMVSNGSLWTVPDFRNRAKALRERGGMLVTIDPRRTETARIADRHLFIRPDTDVFLLIALLKAVLAREPFRLRHELAMGLDIVAGHLDRFAFPDCANACGVSESDIAWLADKLCSAPSVLYGRMGIAAQEHGTLNAWLINLINIAAGNYDREGGVVFPIPAFDTLTEPTRTIGTIRSRVSGHRDVLGEFPVVALAEEIETEGPGQVRALFTIAGNPTLSVPNGQRLSQAIATLDLFVAIDIYRNASSRLAHYILPPTGPLERDHYGMLLMPLAVRNFASYSPPMLAPKPDALHDWQIIRRLAEAISGSSIEAPDPSDILRAVLANGPWKISLEQLRASPSGVDLGPCEAGVLGSRLQTTSGKIECAPDEFLAALDQIALPDPNVGSGLFLISRRTLRSSNSWLSNSRRLAKGPERCTLEINPVDAASRGLAEGARAIIANGSRSIMATVAITTDMMPGCVSLPHGWGHDLPGVAMAVAREHAGASINDVTDETRLDPLSGNAALAGVRVEVTPAEAKA